MENKEIQNYKNMEKFFKSDVKIKQMLMNISPSGQNFYDQESKLKFVDKYLEALKDIEYEISTILDNFKFDPEVKQSIKQKIKQCEDKIINCNYNMQTIDKMHQKLLTEMDENLISQVKEQCIGYTMYNSPYQLFDNCKTVNEFLHVIHSYIINNEVFLQAMPKIDEKKNAEGYSITLYGKESKLAQDIFDEIPDELEIGWTDIVSLSDNNKIIMMVRDRGHALSFEISKEEQDIWINYFIPKLCNRGMVEKLKGLKKIDDKSKTATGLIRSTMEDAVKEIIDFIETVPMDKDIVLDDDWFDKMKSESDEQKKTEVNESTSEMAVFEEESVKKLTETRRIGKIKSSIETLKNRIFNREKYVNENSGVSKDE